MPMTSGWKSLSFAVNSPARSIGKQALIDLDFMTGLAGSSGHIDRPSWRGRQCVGGDDQYFHIKGSYSVLVPTWNQILLNQNNLFKKHFITQR